MQELVYVPPFTDDEIDLRQFVGKDTELPYLDRFKSEYVLFVPGYSNAPVELRGAGRLRVTVTDDQAEELSTHPSWRFVTPDTAAELERRAKARFLESRPDLAALRGMGADEADRIGPEVEIAPSAPATAEQVKAGTQNTPPKGEGNAPKGGNKSAAQSND